MRHIGLMAGAISSALAVMDQQVVLADISIKTSPANKPARPNGTRTPEPTDESRQVRRARERRTGRY